MDDFLLRALVAGIGVAMVAGPLGSFVVWRRMAYFGDTLAHAALLGVALGVLLDVDVTLGILAVCLTAAVVLGLAHGRRTVADDTLLGILAHGALALGLVAVSFVETVRIDLMDYLFGDILAIGTSDLLWIWGGGLILLAVLAWWWRPLVSATMDEDLARVEGVPVAATRLLLMLLLALTVAVSMKIVGILLITALLIIPAAAARRFAAGPEAMAAFAVVAGVAAVLLGLGASFRFDTPAGPSIVVAATMLFLAAQTVRRRR